MDSIVEFLDDQYARLEAFANAQSRLLNSSMMKVSKDNDDYVAEVQQAVEKFESCRDKVQENLKAMKDNETFCERYNEHVDLCFRVASTIAKNPSWGALGIPSHSAGALESNTVSLAALRASMTTIKEMGGI